MRARVSTDLLHIIYKSTTFVAFQIVTFSLKSKKSHSVIADRKCGNVKEEGVLTPHNGSHLAETWADMQDFVHGCWVVFFAFSLNAVPKINQKEIHDITLLHCTDTARLQCSVLR